MEIHGIVGSMKKAGSTNRLVEVVLKARAKKELRKLVTLVENNKFPPKLVRQLEDKLKLAIGETELGMDIRVRAEPFISALDAFQEVVDGY